MSAATVSDNNNDGTGTQPHEINEITASPDTVSAGTTYLGVNTGGANAVSDINFHGNQAISLTVPYDVNYNNKAYAIYNRDSGYTNWQLNTGDSLTMTVDGSKVTNYGIYNSGANAKVEVTGGSGLAIDLEGTNNVDLGSSGANGNTYDLTKNNQKGVYRAVGADNNAINNVDAADITMNLNGNYSNHAENITVSDPVLLARLNKNIDDAADAYADAVDNYGKGYTNLTLANLIDKQLAIYAAINDYNNAIGNGITANAIYGNTHASNNVNANDINIQINNNIDETQSNVFFHHQTAIYADNYAYNTVNAKDIILRIAKQYNAYNDNADEQHITGDMHHTLYANIYGVEANNNAINDITATRIFPYLDNVNKRGKSDLSHVNEQDYFNIAGLVAYNGGQNKVTVNGTPLNGDDDTTGYSGMIYAIGNASIQDEYSNPNLTLLKNSFIDIQGLKTGNHASNNVTAYGIDAKLIEDQDYDSSNSLFMPSIGFDSYLSISLPTNSELNITNTLNIQAVFADNYAKNTAKAKEITAQISGIGPSIDDDPYSDYDDIATNSQKINYSIPTNVEAIYGNNHSMNYVQTDDISAILNRYGANASNAQWLHFHNVNNVNYAMSMPITVGAIHAENSTVNTIIADNINTDIGKYDNNSTINGLDLGDLQISFEDDNIPIYYTLPAGAKFSFSAPVTAFGAYATNNAINDITTNKINVTTFLMALPSKVASNSNESSVAFWNPNTSRNFSTNIFGLYASNDSLVNLHNNNGNPVEINVGIRDSDDDSSGHGYAHTYDRDDASTYGIYLDKSSANLYDSVIVKGHQVDSGFTALDKPAITHLKDSTFAFAGYEDYDDSYQLHGNHNGSHTFHTYDSSSDGELSLRGTNTFVVNTDILSKKADELFFATMDADSAGQQYISVAADKNMIGDEGKLRGTVPIIDIIDAANNLTTDINALTDVSGNITKYDGKRMIVNTPLRTYKTTPYITTLTADNAHKQVVLTGLDYQMIKPADDMVDANDSQMIMRYMGWLQTDTLMQRLGDLRYDNHTENGIWTRLKKGEYEGEGSYNDSFSQKYNQITVGYDKESARKNGKVYTGFAISHLFGDTDYNDGGSGNQGHGFSPLWHLGALPRCGSHCRALLQQI